MEMVYRERWKAEIAAMRRVKQAIITLQASLPHPTRVVLEGQQHNAMDRGRDVLAQAIITFLLGAQF